MSVFLLAELAKLGRGKMKTKHAELIKSDYVYDKYTAFVDFEGVPNKVGMNKEDALKYIREQLFKMLKTSLKKHMKLFEEFFEWDKKIKGGKYET